VRVSRVAPHHIRWGSIALMVVVGESTVTTVVARVESMRPAPRYAIGVAHIPWTRTLACPLGAGVAAIARVVAIPTVIAAIAAIAIPSVVEASIAHVVAMPALIAVVATVVIIAAAVGVVVIVVAVAAVAAVVVVVAVAAVVVIIIVVVAAAASIPRLAVATVGHEHRHLLLQHSVHLLHLLIGLGQALDCGCGLIVRVAEIIDRLIESLIGVGVLTIHIIGAFRGTHTKSKGACRIGYKTLHADLFFPKNLGMYPTLGGRCTGMPVAVFLGELASLHDGADAYINCVCIADGKTGDCGEK